MNELDQMQNLLQNKIIQISELKQALQAELNSLQTKQKHVPLIKRNIESLMEIIQDIKHIFHSTKQFFRFDVLKEVIVNAGYGSSVGCGKEQEKLKQQLAKMKYQLEQQVQLNSLTKEEVLDLKQMINLHIEKSKKEIDQRDVIIRDLQNSNNHNKILKQKESEVEIIIKAEHLQTINQQQQMNFTSRVFNYQGETNFKPIRQTMTNFTQEAEMNILSVIDREQSSKRTMQSKTRTRFFIEDFRNVVENTNESMDQIPSSFARERYSNIDIDCSESSEAISMFEFGRITNPNHSISVQDKENRERTERISIDFSASQSREMKSKSKEKKIQLTHIQKTPELKLKDPNVMTGSRERCSRFDKKERDSEKKLRVVSIERKKNYVQSRNTAKWICDNLEKVDIYVGDKRTEQNYRGETRGRIREGFGKLEYVNGLVYQGQFKDNTRHGQGTLSLNGNLIYEGQWQKDKLCGKGIIYNIYLVNKRKIPETSFLKTNSYFTGQFRDNSFNGSGIWIINSCQRFESFFKDGLPQGQFKYKNKYGDVEIGNSYPSVEKW